MTLLKNTYGNWKNRFAQLASTEKHIIPMLSSVLNEVRNQNRLAPLFELIQTVSPATAMHSKGVAAVARMLGEKAGLNKKNTTLLAISGVLHDIGKIAVPDQILNKAGPLSTGESREMQSHVKMTISILSTIPIHSTILNWCAFHHERLNGTGYPFGLNRSVLDKGSRIMSIADVFVALTEDRIYRDGMAPNDAVSVMEVMVGANELDTELFEILRVEPSLYNDTRLLIQHDTNSLQVAS